MNKKNPMINFEVFESRSKNQISTWISPHFTLFISIFRTCSARWRDSHKELYKFYSRRIYSNIAFANTAFDKHISNTKEIGWSPFPWLLLSFKRSHMESCILTITILAQENQMYGNTTVSFINRECQQFYKTFVFLDESDIIQLCLRTKEQSKCPKWPRSRQVRISASTKAHCIKRMTRETAPELTKDFLKEKFFKKIDSLEYGLTNEKKALEPYKINNDVHVFSLGVLVSPIQPRPCFSASFIGCSLGAHATKGPAPQQSRHQKKKKK